MIDQIKVAGRGLATLNIPARIRVASFVLFLLIFANIMCALLAATSFVWKIGTQVLSNTVAMYLALVATIAAALSFVLARLGVHRQLLHLRKVQREIKWGGPATLRLRLAFIAVLAGLTTTLVFLAQHLKDQWPIATTLSKIQLSSTPASPQEAMVPIYFWEYLTWVKPDWLDQVDIVLPYEKGPPQKLLSKIYFSSERKNLLELHGKRPRQYPVSELTQLFESNTVHPRDFELVWALQKEAGLATESTKTTELTLITFSSNQNTRAVGRLWKQADSTSLSDGRLAYLSPAGAVYQVHCSSPCLFSRMLELVEFQNSNAQSTKRRIEFTSARLKELLEGLPKISSPNARKRHENLLVLYLVSMLTLNPADTEAYFHLGKISSVGETIASAIRYAKDSGLEPAKLAELESKRDSK